MEIKIYEKSVIDDLVEQELVEMNETIEKIISLANETSNLKIALETFLEMLNINGVIKKLPFDFSEEDRIVRVKIGSICKKTDKTDPANPMRIVTSLLLKKEETDNCCDRELAEITASVERMIMLAYKTADPSSVLLSFTEHLWEINMNLPCKLRKLGILE